MQYQHPTLQLQNSHLNYQPPPTAPLGASTIPSIPGPNQSAQGQLSIPRQIQISSRLNLGQTNLKAALAQLDSYVDRTIQNSAEKRKGAKFRETLQRSKAQRRSNEQFFEKSRGVRRRSEKTLKDFPVESTPARKRKID